MCEKCREGLKEAIRNMNMTREALIDEVILKAYELNMRVGEKAINAKANEIIDLIESEHDSRDYWIAVQEATLEAYRDRVIEAVENMGIDRDLETLITEAIKQCFGDMKL